MKMKLAQTLGSWFKRYGSEAAFVGRVAVAAFVPPGANILIEKGLEAAFEYIQSQPEQKINEQVLSEQIATVGLNSSQAGQLSQLVQQIDQSAQSTLEHAFQSKQTGSSRLDIEQSLRKMIAQDPNLIALRNTLEQLSHSLTLLTQQGEVLIAGQAYQAAALEEMMQMVRDMAKQLSCGQNVQTPVPSKFSSIDSLSASGLIFGRENEDIKEVHSALNALDHISSLHESQGQNHVLNSGPNTATELVERFRELTQKQKSKTEISQKSSIQFGHRFDCPQVGEGRVALTLIEVGHQPLLVIKWLCESWSYSLADALIATQNTPVTIKRSDQFVHLGQAQQSLNHLGAKLKLNT